jgi:hypothetical protein
VSESRTHAILVTAIVSWVHETCCQAPGIVRVDSADTAIGTRPPAIISYVPDVYISNAGGYDVIVGEAKTARDLERPHSQAQFAAFLSWCGRHSDSLLVVAVPWYMTRAARNLIRHLQQRTNTQRVRTIVLDRLGG